MRTLSAARLLDAWEHGLGLPPAARALSLLAAADPDTAPETLARLSVGQRDERLLTLRERTFGPRLAAVASCPGCAERLDLAFETAAIRDGSDADRAAEHTLAAEGYELRFRLPDSRDLALLAGLGDVQTARLALLERCLLEARLDGESRGAGELPDAVVGALAERMAHVDRQADVRLALTCPACGREWQAAFDIASYFWSELHDWAQHTLRDVHLLATAYGWREDDILALSPRRRQLYLEMIGA